jgi:CHAD domain-containing protein
VFALPDDVRSAQVISNISNEFRTVFPPARRLLLQYFDTFDWRLYDRGLVMIRVNDEYRLRRIADDSTVGSCRAPDDNAFWWEFPECPLRERIRSIIEERALMLIGEVGLRVRDVHVLNSDEKTVVRARVEVGEAFNSANVAAPVRVINILPVRGYRKNARRFATFLSDAGLQPAERDTFEVAVEMKGRRPGDYSSKLKLALDESMTGQEAAGVIFRHLVDTMQRNEAGIEKDIDTEFLHDLRVAVRRTRSGLTQIKGVLPSGITTDYRTRFAALGRSTNRLRDLDVYLLRRGEYRKMLAEDLQPALAPLFDSLASEREKELAAVVRTIRGSEYRALLRDWRETLDAIGSPALDAKNAGVPVGILARRFIKKWHVRVTDTGARIDDNTPDAALHALRIDCKKLRYLLEFFASLFSAEEIGLFVKQLKRLQDNLGDFNDLSVQQSELKSFLHGESRKIPVDTAAAVGALVARLEDRHKAVRKQFAESFAAFAGDDNRNRFDELFGKPSG